MGTYECQQVYEYGDGKENWEKIYAIDEDFAANEYAEAHSAPEDYDRGWAGDEAVVVKDEDGNVSIFEIEFEMVPMATARRIREA